MTKKPKNEAAAAMGRKGGRKNKRKGKRYFSDIGKKGAAARWGKKV